MKRPIDPPPVDPKVGKLFELCEEEDTTLGLTSLHKIAGFHIEMGRNVWWNKSNITALSARFNMWQERKEIKRDTVSP